MMSNTTPGGDDFNNNNVDMDHHDHNNAAVDFTDEDISPIERGESAASLPNAEEVRATVYAEQGGAPRKSSSRCCNKWMIVAILLAVIALSVGLGVGLSNKENAEASSSSSSSSVEKNGSSSASNNGGAKTPAADAPAPAPAPRLSSYTEIKDYVVAQGISDENDFDTNDSPQARAASWMADIDGYNIAIPDNTSGSNIIASATVPSQSDAYRFLARYVLTVLYYATNGENWTNQFNFLSPDDVCEWNGALADTTGKRYIPFGAFCDSDYGAIWGLYLDRLELQGEIPKELGKLITLELLDMTFNDLLGGSFPQTLCELTNLKALFLGYTQISGELPACIGQLSELTSFFMSDTLMGGPLPDEMSQLTKMEKLLLDDNVFSGDITSTFNEMKALEYLFLEDNDFSATLDENFLADTGNLTQLDLSDNIIVGSIPAHLFDIKAHPYMQLIDLHGNGLSGALPDIPETNEFMLFVALHDNSITGNVPATWTYLLPELFHLDLSNNLLDGPMSSNIGNMASLRYLFLADNDFDQGPIPSTFANLTTLEEISLKRTQRNGTFPDYIATAWPGLVLLDLDNNALSGPLPESLGNLTTLEFLLINRNQLSGEIPASLGKLINLRAVFMEQNQLTGVLDDTMCKLPAFAMANGVNVGNPVMATDCGTEALATDASPTKLVTCECCAICCTPGINDCHDENEIANLNPEWEIGYGRFSFNFGNETRFVNSDYLGRRLRK